jgi:hypothetical protein
MNKIVIEEIVNVSNISVLEPTKLKVIIKENDVYLTELYKNEAKVFRDEAEAFRDESLLASQEAKISENNALLSANNAEVQAVKAENEADRAEDEAEKALLSAEQAFQSFEDANESATLAFEFKQEAKEFRDEAEQFRNEAEQFTKTSWISLVSQWSVEPFELSSSSTGSIFQYQKGSVIYYRFVPNPYEPSLDAFYEDINLTTLITTRG